MDPNNAIEVRNLTKKYKIEVRDREKQSIFGSPCTKKIEKIVLDSISFDIKKGDVLGVIGKNGCGKSTLLSLLARIMEPDSGTIERNGKVASILELGMGFHSDLSGRENIYLKSELYGFSKKQIDEKIDEIIEYSGVGEYIDNPVRTYSSGMKGRLAFAIMVNVESEIMLIDEVLSIGDTAFGKKAKGHFKKLSQSGKTIVIVSHSIESIEKMCNRVIWLENGKIKKDGESGLICSEYRNFINDMPDVIMELAIAGMPDSQYRLATLYRDGVYFEQNDELYKHWIYEAALQGHVRAQSEYGDTMAREGNMEDALTYYSLAASRGDKDAKMKLASMNTSKDEDIIELIKIWKQISEFGGALAKYRYATLLLKTAWSNEDRTEALLQFKKSAEAGYGEAYYQLGIMYRDGIGTAIDKIQMEENLLKGVELNNIKSILLLADLYSQGRILPKNDSMAFVLYLKAAEFGDVSSMFKISQLLKDGIGADVSVEESDKWLKAYAKSNLAWYRIWASDYVSVGIIDTKETVSSLIHDCENALIPVALEKSIMCNGSSNNNLEKLELKALSDNIDALRRVGNIYSSGIGINKDIDKAISFYQRSAKLGDLVSKYKLAELLTQIADEKESIYWYKQCAIQGNINSITILIDKNVEVFNHEPLDMLKSLANNGNVDAIRRLGDFYYNGTVMKKDYGLALQWYKIAAELGDSFSKARLSEMYRNGKGTKVNLEESFRWYIQ